MEFFFLFLFSSYFILNKKLCDIEDLVKISKKPKLVEFTLENFQTPKKFQFFGEKITGCIEFLF
jgi:hypothetical protein